MRTADLTGALLDYWTARAEGVPADQLEIRPVQRPDPRTPDTICVRFMCPGLIHSALRYDPGTNWALAGPLMEKHITVLSRRAHGGFAAYPTGHDEEVGATPLIAICRAVVRAAFGDEVEDLPC